MLRTIPALFLLIGVSAYAQDVNDATEKAMKDAAAKIAPSIARIETSGGAEAVWGAGRKGPEVMFRRGVGATTGLVADEVGDTVALILGYKNPGEGDVLELAQVAEVVFTRQSPLMHPFEGFAQPPLCDPYPCLQRRDGTHIGEKITHIPTLCFLK